jgi:glutamate-ammonia-ligase adenylyltransferase
MQEALTTPRDPAAVLHDAAAMRARLLRELPPDGPWDIKAMPGGMIEVEFIAQALTVAHAHAHPRLLRGTTREVLKALGREGLMPEREAATLIQAERLWRTLLGMLRLTLGPWKEAALPLPAEEALREAAATLVGHAIPDLPALRRVMEEHAAAVRASFTRHVGA